MSRNVSSCVIVAALLCIVQANVTDLSIGTSILSSVSSIATTSEITTQGTTAEPQQFVVPPNCSAFRLLPDQPNTLTKSPVRKCCPLGQNFQYEKSGRRFCGNETLPFNVEPIYAKFYEHCIEDIELIVPSVIIVENNCNRGLVYSGKYEDLLYVLQNGSLLRVAADLTSYDIFEHYCLDMDHEDEVLTAIVCEYDDLLIPVARAQALLFAACMMMSVPCLLATSAFYLLVPELNDLHGKSLAGHSIGLAVGFGMLAVTQFRDHSLIEGYIIQFCLLTCFFWLLVMWIDICLHAWYYLSRGLNPSESDDNYHLGWYALIALGIPLVLTACTYKAGLSGLPSYYIKGVTQVGRSSQMFFIPPISFTLCLNLVLYASSYFGFRRLQEIRITEFLAMNIGKCQAQCRRPIHNAKHIAKVETMFKSTSYLTLIMTINWIFEIISFYTDAQSTIFDVVNALQGVFIFIIFCGLPRPRQLIRYWWKDQGSYSTTPRVHLTEMQTLNSSS